MRKLTAWVFNCSVDGLLADEGTSFWDFCFSRQPDDSDAKARQLEEYRTAYAHIMGRSAYEGMHQGMTSNPGHPFAPILNQGRKVVFSKTLRAAEWQNTTIASGDTREEIDRLRQGGDGHIIAWGGIGLWRSLIALDLLDEFHFSIYPYIAGTGTRLFAGMPADYELETVSANIMSNGILGVRYRRPR